MEKTNNNKFKNFIMKLVKIFKDTKFGQFFLKWHLHYLLMAILIYGIKAALYFGVASFTSTVMPGNIVQLHMEIDNMIPFIPYFYVFYVSYYILPEIFLWLLSFKNKRKVFNLVIGLLLANIFCCICYLIKNVQMIRPWDEVGPITFSNMKSFRDFFVACVHWQYDADKDGLNCFPSLHATFGMRLILIGIPTSKKEPHFPLASRIICIVFGTGIILSTVFIKQHYFIDAVVGAAQMVGFYFLGKLILSAILKRK